jgi:hypothetical protein
MVAQPMEDANKRDAGHATAFTNNELRVCCMYWPCMGGADDCRVTKFCVNACFRVHIGTGVETSKPVQRDFVQAARIQAVHLPSS